MEIEQLIDTACERAGSDDFGGDTWREGLEVLVQSLNTEALLNEMGVGAMTDQIVGYLLNRLRIEAVVRRASRHRRSSRSCLRCSGSASPAPGPPP